MHVILRLYRLWSTTYSKCLVSCAGEQHVTVCRLNMERQFHSWNEAVFMFWYEGAITHGFPALFRS
jgi:hypothetical protein